MNERIYLSPPHMGGDELRLVTEAFEQNWVAPTGPHVNAFENEISTYLKEAVSVAVLSSGTAAIHLALILLGVKEGDEVICSTFTFSGSCNPIVYQKAKPVFVDSEMETWNMDPQLLRQALHEGKHRGKLAKAIILVHLYGMPAKIDEILAIAAEFGVPVIEDAAEAFASTYNGRECGTFGDFGVLSFNGNKIITTSGGGALVASKKEWIEKARFLATQARDAAPHYQHSEIGYNYRMSNICAGIGRGQLKVLQQRAERKRDIFDAYKRYLADAVFSFQPELPQSCSNRWLTTLTFVDVKVSPEEIRQELEKSNIESRPLWKPMHLQPVFAACKAYTNGVSEQLFKTGICLPSGTAMTEEQIALVAKKVTNRIGIAAKRSNFQGVTNAIQPE